MSKITGNEPAMPINGADKKFFNCNNESDYIEWVKQCNPSIGLTKREHFAAMAMQGVISSSGSVNLDEALKIPSNTAKWAVAFADALITELNKQS